MVHHNITNDIKLAWFHLKTEMENIPDWLAENPPVFQRHYRLEISGREIFGFVTADKLRQCRFLSVIPAQCYVALVFHQLCFLLDDVISL